MKDRPDRHPRPFVLLPLGFLALLLAISRLPETQDATGPEPDPPSPSSFAGGPSARLEPESDPALHARVSRFLRAGEARPQTGRAVMAPVGSIAPAITSPDLVPKLAPVTEAQRRSLAGWQRRLPGKRLEFRTGEQNHALTYLKGRRLQVRAESARTGLSRAATTARLLFENHPEAFALAAPEKELRLVREETDRLGYTQLHYQQRYQNRDVVPASLMVQLDPAGHAHLVFGAYRPTPAHAALRPQVQRDAAAAIAQQHLETGQIPLSQRLVYFAPDGAAVELAYEIEIQADLETYGRVYVDAVDGEVLGYHKLICGARVTGSGTNSRGETVPLELWQHSDSRLYMIDTSKPMYDPSSFPPNLASTRGAISILDAQDASNANATNAARLISSASPSSGFLTDAVDVATNLAAIYEFFRTEYGRNSFDGRGIGITAIVNVNMANAYFRPGLDILLFGNQNGWGRTLDFAAHEFTHGVIHKTSDLVYENQSGALNEAIADIFGEGAEHAITGSNDWKVGTSLDRVLRAMDDPSEMLISGLRPFPKTMSDYIPPDDPFLDRFPNRDSGGVHFNSSIINHCFYLLAEGLDDPIGIEDALDIFYRAVTTKLTKASGFTHCRLACLESAGELFGAGSPQRTATARAFDAVEIFDAAPVNTLNNIPSIEAPDSLLFVFRSGGQSFLGRRESQFGDGAQGVFLGSGGQPTPVADDKRPSVTGDGARAFYVTPDWDAAFIDTMSGQRTLLGMAGGVESCAISPDGRTYALLLRQPNGDPDNRIMVVDTETDESVIYELGHPAPDSDIIDKDSIEFTDTLAFSINGRYLFFDAQLRLTYPDGGFDQVWMVYYIDRETSRITSLFRPDGTFNVSSMFLGQRHPTWITFDIYNFGGPFEVHAGDFSTGELQRLAVLGDGSSLGFGWPFFSGDDSAVVYTNHFNDFGARRITQLVSQPIQATGFAPSADPFVWHANVGDFGPDIGTIYRRGAFESLPVLAVAATDPAASETGDEAVFTISRTGDTSSALSFQVLLTGAASNGVDFSALALQSQVPAGQSSVEYRVVPIDDSAAEGPEGLTLTLEDAFHYSLGPGRSATVTIADDEPAPEGFAQWAQDEGLPPDSFLGDTDGDDIVHGIEYAVGLEPRRKENQDFLTVREIDGWAVAELQRVAAAPDIEYRIEFSLTQAPGSWSTSGLTTLADSPTLLRVRAPEPLDGTGRGFFRLVVTAR